MRDKEPRYITEEEVKAHIGLHTNASSKTWLQVVKDQVRQFRDNNKEVKE
jgi:hypothetical protein